MISAVPAHARWRCRLAATALMSVVAFATVALAAAPSLVLERAFWDRLDRVPSAPPPPPPLVPVQPSVISSIEEAVEAQAASLADGTWAAEVAPEFDAAQADAPIVAMCSECERDWVVSGIAGLVTSVVKGAVNLAEFPMSVDQLLPKGSHVDLLGMPGQRIELTHASIEYVNPTTIHLGLCRNDMEWLREQEPAMQTHPTRRWLTALHMAHGVGTQHMAHGTRLSLTHAHTQLLLPLLGRTRRPSSTSARRAATTTSRCSSPGSTRR
jgi:hypothetical protein